MKCPQCEDSVRFLICATTVRMVEVTPDGDVIEDDGGDILWEDDSRAECGECAWSGTAKDLEDAEDAD